MKYLNKQENRPYKVLWFGDLVVLSGFGRIGNEVTQRLRQRGYDVQGIGLGYGGWPHNAPFWIWPTAGVDIWNTLAGVVNQFKPDVIVSCQDFPYHQTIWQACKIDFSRTKWVWITPIDGTPVHPDWVKLTDWADGAMVISRFGQEAMRDAGKRVELCHPGVNTSEIYPAEADEKKALRELAGFLPDDYVVGVVCMNQGRKAIPPMISAFYEFAKDKPNAKLYLDMDKVSPAGWDIPNLLKQMGLSEADQKRTVFKDDVWKSATEKSNTPEHALLPLRARYALMDAHMVISHREGFGLPLLESMACRVPTLALDWCSGTELVGEGRGALVERLPYMEYGTWGGARDAFPDVAHITEHLQRLYQAPNISAEMAERGYQWAIKQTWDVAADQVETVIQSALSRKRMEKPSHEPKPIPAPTLSDTNGPSRQTGPIGPAAPTQAEHGVSDHPGVQQPASPHPVP